MDGFVAVAAVDEVPPGSVRRIEVGGQAVALFNEGGEFYALADTCSHEQASLSEGYVEAGVVECPLHGARFDLRTGRNLSLPALFPVAAYDVRVEAGQVWVRPKR